jgi:hypothetical protein
MTFPEAVEEVLAVSIAAYLGGQRRERLREAIELTVRALDEFDQQRLGITPDQLATLIGWASTGNLTETGSCPCFLGVGALNPIGGRP